MQEIREIITANIQECADIIEKFSQSVAERFPYMKWENEYLWGLVDRLQHDAYLAEEICTEEMWNQDVLWYVNRARNGINAVIKAAKNPVDDPYYNNLRVAFNKMNDVRELIRNLPEYAERFTYQIELTLADYDKFLDVLQDDYETEINLDGIYGKVDQAEFNRELFYTSLRPGEIVDEEAHFRFMVSFNTYPLAFARIERDMGIVTQIDGLRTMYDAQRDSPAAINN